MWIHILTILIISPTNEALTCANSSATGCLDGCASNPCPKGSNCISKDEKEFSCICPDGLTHPLCHVNYQACSSRPCLNNATCSTDGGNGYICNCADGFSGRNCEIYAGHCVPNPCQNSGKCHQRVDGYECECNGWAGFNCEIAINPRSILQCNSTSCLNNGTCHVIENKLKCSCSENFTGAKCETPIDNCSTNPCKNNGACVPTHDKYECKCVTGFEGAHCEISVGGNCLNVQCPGNQICVDVGNSYDCHCPPGVANCTQQINICASHSCQNGGICIEENNMAKCKCRPGYTGDNCETHNSECASNPCQNGICRMRVDGTPECYCQPGYSGTYCTMNVNECLSSPCKNSATCHDLVNGYECLCAPGYNGTNCETDIDECEVKPCYNQATCQDGINSYTCHCLAGFTGQNCEIDIDECESQPCLNEGQCIDHVNIFTCNCTDTGFTGLLCENNIDDCVDSVCMNNATCSDLIKDYKCNCYEGYTGKHCEVDIDECATHPCENEGLCLERSNYSHYTNNYLGLFPNPFNYETANGYICHCVPGFRGENCSENINECESNPCINGKCIDGINSYTCDCLHGFEGLNCEIEIDECERFYPCSNGSACENTIGNYVCHCPEDYGGKNCSVLLTGCVNNLCENNSTCHQYLIGEDQQAYNCSCVHGFYGQHCEAVSTLSLNGLKPLTVAITGDSEMHKLEFRFRTTLPDGMLFYSQNTDTFYSLMLDKSDLVLGLGYTGAHTTEYRIGRGLNDASWVTVMLEFNSMNVSVIVQGKVKSYEKLINLTVPAMWVFSSVYMGGTLLPGFKLFTGCLEDVIVNEQFVTPSSLKGEVVEGCPREEQCLADTCNQNGKCVDMWNKFKCDCRRPHLGPTCNYSYVPATFGFENTTSLAVVSFSSDEQEKLKTDINISMFIMTREETGLMFYFGSFGPERDNSYVAVDINNGQIRLSIRCGKKFYTYAPLKKMINNGELHLLEVVIVRFKQFGLETGNILLSLNYTVVLNVTESLPDDFQVARIFLGSLLQNGVRRKRQVPDWYDFVNADGSSDRVEASNPESHEYITISPFVMNANERIASTNGFTASLNKQDIPVGSTSSPGNEGHNELMGSFTRKRLKAVLQDIRINGKQVVFYPSEIENGNLTTIENVTLISIQKGIRSDPLCQPNPCKNEGVCSLTYNEYDCACTTGFRGKNCTLKDFCISHPCPTGSLCNSLIDGFECISNATFDGVSTITYSSKLTQPVTTIAFNYRSQNPGLILSTLNTTTGYRLSLILKKTNFELIREMNEVITSTIELPFMKNLTDGTWHRVRLEIFDNNIEMLIDSDTINRNVAGDDITGIFNGDTVSVGGYPEMKSPVFKGCLRDLRFENFLLSFYDQNEVGNTNASDQPFLKISSQGVSNNECRLCFEESCQNNGTCSDPFESFDCDCNGFEGQFCAVDIDECLVVSCKSGTCLNTPGSFRCICQPGYTGEFCEKDIDECLEHPCNNGGTCRNLLGSYACVCNSNYTGVNCEELLEVTCDHDPCKNGATCQPNPDAPDKYKYTCVCTDGYEGRNCIDEKDFCKQGICNSGICKNDPVHAYVICICVEGFTGKHCETDIDECASEPCLNGGSCIDEINAYSCKCPLGLTGANCEEDINECEILPEICENGGMCKNDFGGFTCECADPFFGERCSFEDPCQIDKFSCHNGGTCYSDEFNSTGLELYRCECHASFKGQHCQQEITEEDSSNMLALILGPIIAIILVVITIAAIVLLMMARKKRATRGTYSPSRQEMFGSRVELGHVMKPPPEERLI